MVALKRPRPHQSGRALENGYARSSSRPKAVLRLRASRPAHQRRNSCKDELRTLPAATDLGCELPLPGLASEISLMLPPQHAIRLVHLFLQLLIGCSLSLSRAPYADLTRD
jgi:hypothetical protein